MDGTENARCVAGRNAPNTFACLKVNFALVHYESLSERKECCRSGSLFHSKEFFIAERDINFD